MERNMDQHSADLAAPQGAPASTGDTARPTTPKRSFASLLFGYDIFLSFALGPPPRGTHSYASDLARRLRERDFSVFFSEEEASPGEQLDSTLRTALLRSKTLVVIANRGTLQEPRWVRKEVEEFRENHPDRPVITINVDGALQDPTLAESAQEWLDYQGKIWLDESEEAVAEGIASGPVVERLSIAPARYKSNVKWRWVRDGAIVVLAALAIGLAIAAKKASDNASEAIRQRDFAEKRMRMAQAQQLAAQSNSFRESFPDRSLLLAVAGIFRTAKADGLAIPAAEQSLIDSLSVTGGVPMRDHEGRVQSVAFSPDGKSLASGSYDETIRIRSLVDQKARPIVLKGHSSRSCRSRSTVKRRRWLQGVMTERYASGIWRTRRLSPLS